MKKLIFALAICIATIVSAQAQTKHEKVLNLIRLTKADQMIDNTFKTLPQTLMQSIGADTKDTTAQRKAMVVMESTFSIIKDISKRLINEDMVTMYEKYFTDADIDSYIKFYESPAGKKMVDVQPEMQKDLMNIMFSKYIPEMKAKMEAKMKELKSSDKK